MTDQRQRVIVSGGGFGALSVTSALAQSPVGSTMGQRLGTMEQAYDEVVHDEHRPPSHARPRQPVAPAPRHAAGREADREVVP